MNENDKRILCFTLISGIERDLRILISEEIDNEFEKFLPSDVVALAKERYCSCNKEVFKEGTNLIELLEYIDFYDLKKILDKIKTIQSIFTASELNFISESLLELTGCRNRVCHSRALEENDYDDLLNFAKNLVKINSIFKWYNLNHSINNLTEKDTFSIKIPEFWEETKKTIFNNLPSSEFEDTGFLGRAKDRLAINRLLTSNIKVISIVGEGGIGKTALANKCLKDILEICQSNDNSLFDMIIWVSLKTNRLTVTGISNIYNAINSSTGLFENISNVLGSNPTKSMDDLLNEITDYMSTFKTLLCIDNLETISSDNVRSFLSTIPEKSKVLITTRIGLGEIEYRYKLDKLDEKSAIDLARKMAKVLNIESMIKQNNNFFKILCKDLFYNPLLIKWHILGNASGLSSQSVKKSSGSFQEALRFCFENLYDKLGEVEIYTISILACIRKPISAAELRFYMTEVSETDVIEAINKLHNSSMLISTSNKNEQGSEIYSLTSIAEEFIASIRPVSNEMYQIVQDKRKELHLIIQENSIQKNHYDYDINGIYWKTKDEKLCSIYLKKALQEYNPHNIKASEDHVLKAKSILPEFSESYRIHAYILREVSPFRAENELEKAIEFAPDSSITRYAYAQLLITQEDFIGAEEQIDQALLIDKDALPLKTCKAWILTLNGNYSSAIELYDDIIKEKNLHRKFRISTYDQALTCYYRHILKLSESDNIEVVKYINKAYILIKLLIKDNDFDKTILTKLCKFLNLSINYYKSTYKPELIIGFFNTIDSYFTNFDNNSLYVIKLYIVNIEESFELSQFHAISTILSKIKKCEQGSTSKQLKGHISSLKKEKDTLSYGFIKTFDDKSYFFHRSEIIPESLANQIEINTQVNFTPSVCKDGRTIAKEITISKT